MIHNKLLLLAAIGCALCTGLWAQATAGSISGIVQDPQGAVVAGAKVTLTNEAQGAASARQVTPPKGTGTRTESLVVPNGRTPSGTEHPAPAKNGAKHADSGTPAALPTTAAALPTTAAIVPAPVVAPPGLLRVRAYPVDAELFVDGQSLGRGVVLDAPVPGGRRKLRVSAPGYSDFDTTITVASGRTTQLPKITLRPTESAP